MNTILAQVLADPQISPTFKRVLRAVDTLDPHEGLLNSALLKQMPRRFTGEPVTGFGDLELPTDETRARWAREDRDDAAFEEERMERGA